MEVLADYAAFFALVGAHSFRALLRPLLSPSLGNPLYLGIWITAFILACEHLFPWRRSQPRLRQGVWLDVFYTVFFLLLFAALVAHPIVSTAQLAFHQALHAVLGVQIPQVVRLGGLPLWARWTLLFLVSDFLSYLGHRLLHANAFLWRLHQVHHSSRRLDALNAVRLHWGEKIFYALFSYVPMSMIGFEAQQIFAVTLVGLFLCLFTHANVRVPLGPLVYVLNCPQLHLWHHALEIPARRNVNYGSALSLWDFLLGTAHLPDGRSDLELGFEGVDRFPTTLWGQQTWPLGAAAARLRGRAS